MDIHLRDLLHQPQLRVEDLIVAPDDLTVLAATTTAAADCPACGQPSSRVPGRYVRCLRDLSCLGRPVHLRLTARKFLCRNSSCPRTVFGERLPEVVASHARTTARLAEVARAFGLALGGEAGARLARRLAVHVSPDTLLRRVKRAQSTPPDVPRVVGVDDWAWRKGQRYGTILIDLESRRVLDLLPDREGPTRVRWLQGQPQVEVISRDRSGSSAQAATEGAPQAKQVADRWHLLKNLRETLQRLFERLASAVTAVLTPPANLPVAAAAATPLAPADPAVLDCPPTTSLRQQARQAKKEQRTQRYHEVRRLHQEGKPIRAIARAVGLSRGSVRRYLRSDRCPDWQRREPPRTQLDGFREYIDGRIEAGCQDATALHQELTERGARAS